MKYTSYIYIILFLCCFSYAQAQQQPLYTQFMYNKLVINPGYAGSLETTAATLLHRSQWIGFDGAPQVQALSVHGSLANQNIGLGGFVTHMTAGIAKFTTLGGVYTYRLKMGDGALRLGLSPSVRYYVVDYTDERLNATEGIEIDNSIPAGVESKFIANIGFGAYYHTENFFIGASLPRLAQSSIDFIDDDIEVARESRHLYLMAGYTIDLSSQFTLTPQTVFKLVEGSPYDFDVNAMLSYREKFNLGLTYRNYKGIDNNIAESIDILTGFQVAQPLYIGLSYDIGLNKLAEYHNGSIEIALRYLFIKPEQRLKFDNPRYF